MSELSQPVVAGHGPVFTGLVHDGRGLVNELGTEFGLRTDNRIHDVRAFLFQRNANGGELVAGFVFLPLQAVDPLVFLDPHLVHGGGVAVTGILQVLRRNPQKMRNTAHSGHQERGVDAEGAIHDAAAAQIAFGVGDTRGLFHKGGRNLTLVFNHGQQSLLHLADRGKKVDPCCASGNSGRHPHTTHSVHRFS